QPGMLEKYGKGTPNDWLERHVLARLPWLGIVLMLGIDIYLFGFFIGPLVWGIQMLWIPFWAAGIINGVGHALGYRNFNVKDESRNILPLAIWLGGEELHTITTPIRTPRSSRRSGTSSMWAGPTFACSSCSGSRK